METLAIFLGERRGGVAEIIRGGDAPLTIGRGLDNDVVLTDPHVGPQHLRFYRRDGHWYASALDSVNPVLVNDELQASKEITLVSGDHITIGRTRLVVYSKDHPVAPARKLLLSSWLHRGRAAFLLAFVVCAAVSLFGAVLDQVSYPKAAELEGLVSSTLSSIVLLMVWAAVWALVGRLVRHQGHYPIQLLVTGLVSILVTIAVPLPAYVDYWFANTALTEAFAFALAIALMALLLRWNIYYATHPDRPWLQATFMAVVCVGAYLGVSKLQEPEYDPRPGFSASLKPPFVLFTQGQTPEYFLIKSGEAATRAAAHLSTSVPLSSELSSEENR